MNIKLSDHFDCKRLLRFTFPSVIMMIFTSVYGVVDGLFVSNYAGPTQFTAVNLIMPFLMIFGAIGFMIGAGGSALVSMTLGTGNQKRANEIFSLLIYVLIAVGAVFTLLGIIFIKPVAVLLGATGDLLDYCVSYGTIIILALVPFMLQNVFQSFMVTAERPKLGLYITIAAGVCNMLLDILFVACFGWGVEGAAAATAASQFVGGLVPFLYFIFSKKSRLKLVKTKFYGREILKACTNGSSEFMTNVSISLVNMLYNHQLLIYAGQDGVASYGVIMYVGFIFVAVYIGYSIGCAPIVGYHYGAGNCGELKNIRKKSLGIIAVFSIVLTLLAELSAPLLANIFVGYDSNLFAMTVHGFILYSFSYLLCGFNIYGSAFFTALNNGAVSALISFSRLFVFQVLSVIFLPLLIGVDGIWFSIVPAELMALLLTLICFKVNRKKYKY